MKLFTAMNTLPSAAMVSVLAIFTVTWCSISQFSFNFATAQWSLLVTGLWHKAQPQVSDFTPSGSTHYVQNFSACYNRQLH